MRALIIILSCITLNACTEDHLIGKWCESLDGGGTCFGYEIFSEFGEVSSTGVFPNSDVGYEMSGKYERKGNSVCCKRSTNPL